MACVKAKRKEASRAEELYISQLFRKCRRVAEGKYGVWYILSAEYGLLEPSRVVEPYEKTLNRASRDERRRWAGCVFLDIRKKVDRAEPLTILAGIRYREFLVPMLEAEGYTVSVPLERLPIGKQLKKLNEMVRG